MLSEIVNAAAAALGNLGAPVHAVTRVAQELIADATAPEDRAGSAATTTSGSLASGPRPSAAELHAARVNTTGGDVDHDRARRDAERTLASIDFSRSDIVLWVPATNAHSVPAAWQAGVDAQFGGRASIALVDYPANVNFIDSVATGQETLRLVLAGIAERGGSHRVTLAGHSQGAWVIGDAINEPTIGRMVDKAVLYGQPAPAAVDWSTGAEPRVRLVNDVDDPFTWEVAGGHQALAAIDELHDGLDQPGALDLGGLARRGWQVARTALLNPALAAYLVGKHVVPEDQQQGRDPHHYAAGYEDGAAFLAAR